MFSKLKQYKDLRSQAKTLQNMLAGETITVEKNGITVTMNGNMEIISLSLPADKAGEKLAADIVPAVNEAIKKTQRLMAEKMQSMGGLPGLTG